MTREQLLVQTFVTLADTLIDDYDLIDFMQTLSERCVDLLDVSAAGIMLADADGKLRHVACSSEQMRLVELFELQLEEGPCFDAYRGHEPIASDALSGEAQRWPNFTPFARDKGFRSVSAVPMRLRTSVIGALNLFSTDSRALEPADVAVAQALADIATIGIIQERSIRDHQMLARQLQGALESRIVIEQAKGVVAERAGVGVDVAFQRIRRYSRDHNRLLTDVARDVVNGSLRADVIAAQ
jgi:hypothetical protein